MNQPPNNSQPAQTPIAMPQPAVCTRCKGYGRLPQFNHVQGGICFRCRGNGQQLALSQAATPLSRMAPMATAPLDIKLPAEKLATLRAEALPRVDCAGLLDVNLPVGKLCKARLTPSQWLFLVFVYRTDLPQATLMAYVKHVGLWSREELRDLHDRGYFLRTDRLDTPLTIDNAVVTERFTDLYHSVEIDLLYS